jgi:hypothetical protein
MENLLIIVAIIVVLVLVTALALGWVFYQNRRSEHLRQRFGPEYQHAVQRTGDRRRAESELAEREKQAKSLDIRPLTSEENRRFSKAWQTTQTRFVDQPVEAIADAEILVAEVMEAMGYPAGSFEQRVSYLSVNYPQAAQRYREAQGITRNVRDHDVTTEDLRHAMIGYRQLLDSLLEAGETSVRETGRSRI